MAKPLSDTEIDYIIKSKLAQFPVKGGTTSTRKVSWTQDEIDLMDSVILEYLTKKCCSRERTAQEIKQRWDVNISTARRYVKETIGRMADNYDEDSERMRKLWLEKVQNILESAVATGNKTDALRSLDLLAKSMGLYKENVRISGGDTPIQFDFQ